MQQAGCKLCKSLALSLSHPRCLVGFTFLRATEQLVSWACCCLMTATNASHKMLDNCHKARDLAPQVLTARFTPLQTYPAFSNTIPYLIYLACRSTYNRRSERPYSLRNFDPQIRAMWDPAVASVPNMPACVISMVSRIARRLPGMWTPYTCRTTHDCSTCAISIIWNQSECHYISHTVLYN